MTLDWTYIHVSGISLTFTPSLTRAPIVPLYLRHCSFFNLWIYSIRFVLLLLDSWLSCDWCKAGWMVMTVTVDFHVTGFLGHIKVSLTDWSGQHGEVKQHSQPGGQTCWAALTRLIFVTWVKQKAHDQSWLWAWLKIQMDLWKPYRWERNKGIVFVFKALWIMKRRVNLSLLCIWKLNVLYMGHLYEGKK